MGTGGCHEQTAPVRGAGTLWQMGDRADMDFSAPHLDGYDCIQFNALAEKLRTFGDVDAVAFEGLVQMELNNLYQNNGGELTLRRVLDLAYSVDCCHVVPGITDDAALGQFYVENDFLPDLATVPDSVLEMLDYKKIGRSMREGEGGVLTPHGYVMQESELRQPRPTWAAATKAAVYDLFPLRQRRPCRKAVPTRKAGGAGRRTGLPGGGQLAGGAAGGVRRRHAGDVALHGYGL